jgi:Flp pilus assembly protein TadG
VVRVRCRRETFSQQLPPPLAILNYAFNSIGAPACDSAFSRGQLFPRSIMKTIAKQRRTRRQGVAATEFAMIAPLLLIITFGTIETCSAIFLKEKVTIAAHEGARVAIQKMSTAAQVVDAAQGYLDARRVVISPLTQAQAITVTPDPTTVDRLEPITVRVTAPINGNGLLPNAFYTWFANKYVSAAVVMYKEFEHP